MWDSYLDFYDTTLAPGQTELTWRRILDPDGPIKGRVAVADGELLGFLHYLFHPSTWSDQGYCYLEDLYVHAEARGGGIGRALIGDAIAQALSIGASRVYWSTKHDNHAARRLYDSLAHVTDYVQYSIELDH